MNAIPNNANHRTAVTFSPFSSRCIGVRTTPYRPNFSRTMPGMPLGISPQHPVKTLLMIGILACLSFFLGAFSARPVLAETLSDGDDPIFVAVRLPRGVSIEMPRSWRVFVGDQQEELDMASAETLDLSQTPIPTNLALLRATATPADRPASVTIVYLPRSTFPLAQTVESSSPALAEYDRGLRDSVENQLRTRGIAMLEWGGTRQDRIDGQFALVSEYLRKNSRAPAVREQINVIPLSDGAVLLSAAYTEQAGDAWRSVLMRIRSSCRIDTGKQS